MPDTLFSRKSRPLAFYLKLAAYCALMAGLACNLLQKFQYTEILLLVAAMHAPAHIAARKKKTSDAP